MGAARRAARSPRGRDGPAPTQCEQPQCFDQLLRLCVACRLFRTPDPRRTAAAAGSQVPGALLEPQESVGAGVASEAAPPLPGLLFGAPVLLGLVLALALVVLVSWRWRRRRGTASPETPGGGRDELPGNASFPSMETLDAPAPVWPLPKEDTTPPGHSIPVPATELGSTELVTTKTTGPEHP